MRRRFNSRLEGPFLGGVRDAALRAVPVGLRLCCSACGQRGRSGRGEYGSSRQRSELVRVLLASGAMILRGFPDGTSGGGWHQPGQRLQSRTVRGDGHANSLNIMS